ncbi:GNAT family N-acetyltransferase [Thalassotalea atypica]|uniref:GNAT family N-acetyltransferase n=1 Tax=Thalassotalea atypica TaxID=2054316 RepID=UPI002572A64A|nr:GNAT family N-acetyltransferase [Thalassotalea atypica]
MKSNRWQISPVTEFSQISDAWDELNARNSKQGVLTAMFVQSLIDVFADDSLIILSKYQGNELSFSGIFEQKSAKRWGVFQPSQGPLGVCIADNKNIDRELIDEIVEQLPGPVWLLDLTQLDSAQYKQSDEQLDYLHYISTGSLAIPDDFDQYFSSFSKNTRQNINKSRNRLKKEGIETNLVVVTDPKAIVGAIEKYGEIESKSWKNSLGTAVNINNEQGQFYSNMLTAFAREGQAQVWCYQFNEQLVAVDLCVVHGSTITILKTTFDEAFARYSPSLLLKMDAYKALSKQGTIKHIEYFGKVMDWHRRLKCDERQLFHITWAKSQNVYRLMSWIKQKIKK